MTALSGNTGVRQVIGGSALAALDTVNVATLAALAGTAPGLTAAAPGLAALAPLTATASGLAALAATATAPSDLAGTRSATATAASDFTGTGPRSGPLGAGLALAGTTLLDAAWAGTRT